MHDMIICNKMSFLILFFTAEYYVGNVIHYQNVENTYSEKVLPFYVF